jgi:hypothetical protein
VNVLCGVSDGRGKVCGRPIQHFGGIEPSDDPAYPPFAGRFLVGMCSKHALVAITRDQFDRAQAGGQKAVHLVRGPETDAMLGRIAHRLSDL